MILFLWRGIHKHIAKDRFSILLPQERMRALIVRSDIVRHRNPELCKLRPVAVGVQNHLGYVRLEELPRGAATHNSCVPKLVTVTI